MPQSSERGRVYLVGGGPGDPELITLRGAACLAEADLVLYDGLVNPLLLRLTSGRTERTARIRRHTDAPPVVDQESINERLIAAARSGQVVVRLKGGDPCIFGRGGEEARALAAAGIPFEIVPGVTAATAAAEYVGFSLTDRRHASAVAFITGHEDPERAGRRVDYAALARFPGTLVFYMGLSRLTEICRQLQSAGLPPATPAAVVCQATLATQKVVIGSLQTLPELSAQSDLHPPSLIVIGDCVTDRTGLDWFERLPLSGVSIGITRSDHQFDETARDVVRAGGEPVLLPLLKISPATESQQPAIDQAFARLFDFQWLVFSSVNAVTEFRKQLLASGRDLRMAGPCRIAAVGRTTAAALEDIGLRCDVVPPTWHASALADVLQDQVAGQRVLWFRGSRASDVLPCRLSESGAEIVAVVIYNNHEVPEPDAAVRKRLIEGRLDWVGLASPAAAEVLAALFRKLGVTASTPWPRIAAISPQVAAAAENAGLATHAVAAEASWTSILSVIAAAR